MLPLARELLRTGATVVIAANSAPSINDITAAELDALLPQVGPAGGGCSSLFPVQLAQTSRGASTCVPAANAALAALPCSDKLRPAASWAPA